ncbi:conserved hypothetical protein [Altererythrobacter sp. B11]|uniref:DUF2279 domain-containing protein n=1 Tax=Altererythrobacter sp. B11 TaxID=2060312 RepID=UPI000DC70404|nr:DUF2279 domain-containing protein [Altererythrobacter sp. B11]BBC74369.1 conserved hypothetical protein [Altererythrobacter sp. B11]
MQFPSPRRAAPLRRARTAAFLAIGLAGFATAPAQAQEQAEGMGSTPAVFAALDAAFLPEQTAFPHSATPAYAAPVEAQPDGPIVGPVDDEAEASQPAPPLDSADSLQGAPRRDYASFGKDVAAIKWELAAIAGYYTAINGHKLFDDAQAPHFHSEGWFGKNTNNVGMDKLAHAYSAYVLSELFYARLKHKTGRAPGIQYTAAALASGVMLWSELSDSIEPSGGWSWEDVVMNSAGAGFSILRNSVPGLDEKLDYRLMIEPGDGVYAVAGKRHFQQQRYFFALKLSGFKAFDRSPLRFLELHLGYHGDDFLLSDRAAGTEPKRHVFVGMGINLRELLFKNSKSKVGRAAGEVLDYFQPPYTAVHQHLTD